MAPALSAELTAQLVGNAASLRRLARALVGEGQADDLVQETFEAAWQRPPEDGRPVRPWLRAVLVNRARMSARSRGRRENRELAVESAPPPETPEASVARLELQRRVAGAVLAIAEPYRQTLIWRYVDDLSSEEIARRLEVPAATIRSRLKRGLESVRAELDRGDPSAELGGWRLALLPVAGAPTAVPQVAASLVTGGLMFKLALAVGLAFVAVFFVGQRARSSSALEATTVPSGAPEAATTTAAPTTVAPAPVTSLRRFATSDERARLGAGIALARRGIAPPPRTYDFSASPVPSGPSAAKPTLPPGDLDKDYIQSRIREILPLVRECFELALERRPDLQGTMAIDFVIDAEESVGGYVREARVTDESSLTDSDLAECMTETILSVQFQPPQGGGTVRVVYPFSFLPGDPDEEGATPR